jgi:hypothetical protein
MRGRSWGRWSACAAGGVTLVELLLAVVVVLIAGVSLLGAYHTALHLSEISRESATALSDLRDMMERIKATPFPQLAADFPDGAPNGVVGLGPDLYEAVIGEYRLPNQQITVTHRPNTAADPRELIVEVTWMNQGRAYERRVTTIRTSQAI